METVAIVMRENVFYHYFATLQYNDLYNCIPLFSRYLDMGDISQQLELKNRLQCKSFQWFVDNVAFDLLRKYPELPPNTHWGEVRLYIAT